MNANVLALVGDMDGCALWRVLLPITELQRQGYARFEWGNRDDDRLANVVHHFNAVVLPRLHWRAEDQPKANRWFDALHRAGIAVLYEADDDLFSDRFIDRLMFIHGYDRKTADQRRGWILDALRKCDGATVSSQRVATILRQYTDIPIRVVPNFIDLRWFERVLRAHKRVVPGLTVGWAGGKRPDSDAATMAQAWGRIAKRYPHVTFVVQGYQPQVIYDHVPADRVARLEWMPIDRYPAGLKNIDIGCCPLGNTPFNRAKTPIKAMEYAAARAAVVASPTIYRQIIDHGVDGYICETADEWEEALSELIESEARRHEISRALLSKVRKHHNLEHEVWRWAEAWSSLVKQATKAIIGRSEFAIPSEVCYA